MEKIDHKLPPIPLLLVFALAIWLRLPGISAGLPYLYLEDDTHHLNRTLEMVKSGEYNPHYFHKPSLHFYLRMPVVALSFIWSAKKGYIKSIKEIETRNPFGLAGYNFTASHPGIVKWNRAFSVFLSLVLIFLTAKLCLALTASASASIAAALFTALSPELLLNSPIIGVDVLMALMCLAGVFAGLLTLRSFSLSKLLLCGVMCGLAISSKYNAAPIATIPLAACLLSRQYSYRALLIALLAPILGFFIGSPYILVSIPLFLDHLAYEIWHYAVAGHEGNSAEPGIPQIVFYTRWLLKDGVGWALSLLALFGVFSVIQHSARKSLLFLCFPFLFAALMVVQRVNFTRNVLVLVPFIAILAAAALLQIFSYFKNKTEQAALFYWLVIPFLALQPLVKSVQIRSYLQDIPESRIAAEKFIREERIKLADMAISGELQFPTNLYRQQFVERLDLTKLTPLSIGLAGYSTIIAGPEFQAVSDNLFLLKQLKDFTGVNQTQRIVSNPYIRVFNIDRSAVLTAVNEKYQRNSYEHALTLNANATGADLCPQIQGATEEHCWLNKLATVIKFSNLTAKARNFKERVSLSVMTPWPDQNIKLNAADWNYEYSFKPEDAGKWQDLVFEVPSEILRDQKGILVTLSALHSPSSQGLSVDTRRLGLAIKEARVG